MKRYKYGPEEFGDIREAIRSLNPALKLWTVVYLPQAKVEDMPALARTIQRNAAWGSDEAGHYFDYETYRGRTFYQPGEVQGISANRPCMLAMRVANGKAALALYEPSWQTCALSIGLPFGVNGADAPGIEGISHGFRAAIRPGQPFEFAVSVRE